MFERGFFYECESDSPQNEDVAMRVINKDLIPMNAAQIEKEKNVESEDVTINYCPFCGHVHVQSMIRYSHAMTCLVA
jgi:formate dehydrogenase maturation protein FdhE